MTVLAVAAIVAAPAVHAAAADTVFTHGAVYTMNDRQPWAEAVAVRRGRIEFVGTNAQAQAFVGAKTKVVDLQGRMMLPALGDIHAHPIEASYEILYRCAIPPGASVDAVIAAVAGCAAKAKPGDWIVGGAWPSALLGDLENPANLARLDAASKGFPVLLRDDTAHNRWVNSRALALAGITPQSQAPAGGTYVVKDGRLTGLLKEPPAWLALSKLAPASGKAQLVKAAHAAAATLNRLGVTSVQDAYVTRDYMNAWVGADRSKEGLNLRVIASLASDNAGGEGADFVQPAEANTWRSAHFRPNFVKVFLDGVPMARTAYMRAPYVADDVHGHDFVGVPHYTPDQLKDKLLALDRQGISVKMHAVGDGAVHEALDAIESVRARERPGRAILQIAHITFLDKADLPRFAQLGAVVDMSPMLWYPAPFTPLFDKVVGPERTQESVPIKSLFDAGALVAAGSDWPAARPLPDPWVGIQGMITRRDPEGRMPGVLGPQEAVTLERALLAYTLNPARGMGIDAETGSIEVGKSADLIVLDRNLFKIPVTEIHKTRVLGTWFEGREVVRFR
ncbi:amidohydrolase [Massilia sp. JS1662]|nr:amidohydrolase [Massilia sp. JS1662]